jgi:hypothetical protein
MLYGLAFDPSHSLTEIFTINMNYVDANKEREGQSFQRTWTRMIARHNRTYRQPLFDIST